MIYQCELSIFDDNLNVEIKFLKTDGNEKIKINVNDLLKDSNINEDKNLQLFIYFYNFITCDLNQKSDFALKKVICSNLSFNRKIPLHEIMTYNEMTLFDDEIKLKKEIMKSLTDQVHYVYYCNDRTDLIIACIYHFLNNGFRLKKCPICENWFLENIHKKIKFCDYAKLENEKFCTKKANSLREIKRRQNNPSVRLHKRILDIFDKREDIESQKERDKYMIDYYNAKDTLNAKELLIWLEKKHTQYSRKKKGVINCE